MVDPKVNIQRGIMKNAEKVDTAVMVTERSKFPPNITVQMLEAPPPGEQPENKKHISLRIQQYLYFYSLER